MYPGDPGAPGSDCAGVVIACGAPAAVPPPVPALPAAPLPAGAEDPAAALPPFRTGQHVFGLVHGCLGSVAVADQRMVAPLPPNVAAEEGATLPTAFVTAEAALRQVGRVGRGWGCRGAAAACVPCAGAAVVLSYSSCSGCLSPAALCASVRCLGTRQVVALRAGEAVLLHAGTGGVGLAALQVRGGARGGRWDRRQAGGQKEGSSVPCKACMPSER